MTSWAGVGASETMSNQYPGASDAAPPNLSWVMWYRIGIPTQDSRESARIVHDLLLTLRGELSTSEDAPPRK